ncbi:hypothetical protein KO516_05825 [Citreicella sp. C3M06]|uniref:hypothetical protein n=1 Tax=Roseobacteraceae TaxID=2854170 RepID=UPI001C0A3151|nr:MULTISPECIES: hypothetical protein [Roseobacteraceae]MBU2960344.1 hypothetical protein [Citreicella sp. C3M06]MDO6587047.1 hypothetical protein [Salipiger sp. 1_MG-2023]
MRHLFISSPIMALVLSVSLLQLGAGWWVATSAFFLTAPVLIALALLLCNTILPCHPRDTDD